MTGLATEVRNVQNPALGAGLVWRFCCGYSNSHPTHNATPLPVLFLALPIILHEQTEELLHSTQNSSGLRAFAAKFGRTENSKQDLLLGIHDRMLALKTLSLDSLRIAISARLVHLRGAEVLSLSQTRPGTGIPVDVSRLMKSAEKLGGWCGLLTMHEIATVLKVRF